MTQTKTIPSKITSFLVGLLYSRDDVGQAKYHDSLDRRDLSIEEWLQHQTEELLDGAGYAQAALREITHMRVEMDKLRGAAREYALLRHDMEKVARILDRHDNDFAARTLRKALFTHETGAILRQGASK